MGIARFRELKTERVPERELADLAPDSARLVADLPRGTHEVVWQLGDSELLVQTSGVTMACADALVSVVVPVRCDQLPRTDFVRVTFAVGSRKRPAGLVMASSARPTGHELVLSVWSDALVAFAHETLMHVVQRVAARQGDDKSGRLRIPASIVSLPGVLEVAGMARHSIRWSDL
jgi:hypothetical protein